MAAKKKSTPAPVAPSYAAALGIPVAGVARTVAPTPAPTPAPTQIVLGGQTVTVPASFGAPSPKPTPVQTVPAAQIQQQVQAIAQVVAQVVANSPAVVDTPKGQAPKLEEVQPVIQQTIQAVAPVIAPSLPPVALQNIATNVETAIVSSPEIKKTDVGQTVPPQIVNKIAESTTQVVLGNQTVTVPPAKSTTTLTPTAPTDYATQLGQYLGGVAPAPTAAPTAQPAQTPAPKVEQTIQEQIKTATQAANAKVQESSFNIQKEIDRAMASTIGPVNAVPSVNIGALPINNFNAQAAGAAAMGTLDIQAAAELADAFSSNQVGTTPVGKTIPPAPVTPVMPAPAPSAPPAPGATTPTTPAKPSMTDEQRAARIKASDRLAAQVNAWGFPQIADWLNTKIMAGETEEAVFVQMYDQPEYKTRFPGMEALRKKGKAITEDAYMKIEDAYTQTARFFDLPAGFYDTADDFGNLIANQVSAKEYQDRLQAAQDVAKSADPAIRQALTDLYQVSEGGITAYFANPDRALPIIQKQAKAAQIRGIAKTARFSDIATAGAAALEQLAGREAYAKLTEAQLAQGFTQADILRQTQQRLAAIEGTTFTEQQALSAVIEQNQQELLASQKRAQREQARFGGTTGITGTSLRTTTTI